MTQTKAKTLSKILSLVLCLVVSTISAGSALADDSMLTGRIVDAASKRPIEGVAVRIISREDTVLAEGTTDNDGYYAIPTDHTGWVSIVTNSISHRSVIENNVRLVDGKGFVLDLTLRSLSAIEEIKVTATRQNGALDRSITGRVLSREDIRSTPGTAGDIFRGLSALPGVAATGAYSNFSVRGRGPRDNIILIDGIPYDRAVHFDQSLGQQEDIGGGGRFSIFGQNVVGQATFNPGGWSAAYGGASGSLLNLSLAEGNRETAFYSAKVDLAGGELLYDGPLGKSKDSSLLFSARYYDFGQLFKIVGADDIGTPKLADFLFKSVTQLSADKKLTVIGLYTPEKYTRDINNVLASPSLEDTLLFESDQEAWMFAVKLDQLIGQTGTWKNALYVRKAVDQSYQGEAYPGIGVNTSAIPQDPRILSLKEQDWEIGLQSDYEALNAIGQFRGGVHVSAVKAKYARSASRAYPVFIFDQDDFRVDESQKYAVISPAFYNAQYADRGIRAAAYIDQDVTMNAVTASVGLRLEHDGLLSKTYLSPRAHLRWQASSKTAVNMTFGRYMQAPRLIEIAGNANNSNLSYETTWQTSLGLQHFLNDALQVQIEAWYQRLDDYIPDSDRTTGLLANTGSGDLAGFDFLLLKRFTNQWSASFKYGYVWSRVKDDPAQNYHASAFSRPHLINLTTRYEFNDRWSLGLQYQIASGRPAPSYIIHSDVAAAVNLDRFSLEILDPFAQRYKNFQTLNLRVDYRRTVGKASVIFFADIVNALGRTNIDQVIFSPITGSTDRDGLGVFPQFGLTVEF